jgi:hypothetical protein
MKKSVLCVLCVLSGLFFTGCEFSGASVSAATTDPKTGAVFSGTVTVPPQPRPSPVSPDRFVRDNK